MKRRAYLSLAPALVLVGAILIRTTWLRNAAARRTPESGLPQGAGTPPNAVRAGVAKVYGHLPIHFEANHGQTDSQVKFLAHGIGHTLFLTDREAVLVLTKGEPLAKSTPEHPALTTELALRMSFADANPGSRVTGVEELPGKANYFIGRDPSQWHTDVPLYAKVQYDDLYAGIDLSYSGDQRTLVFEFVVHPGANPDQIVLDLQGVDSLGLDTQGDLLLHTVVGLFRQPRPSAYQNRLGERRDIASGYVLKGARQVGFQITKYDGSRLVVISCSAPFHFSRSTAAVTTVSNIVDRTHSSITPMR